MSPEIKTSHKRKRPTREEIGLRACWVQDRHGLIGSGIAQMLNELPLEYVSPNATDPRPKQIVVVAARNAETGEVIVAPMQPTRADKLLKGLTELAHTLAEMSAPEATSTITVGGTSLDELPHPYVAFRTDTSKPTHLSDKQLSRLDELFANLNESGEFDI